VSDNIKSIGHLLFSFYAIYFIIAGFILLIALVGSIVLTLRKKFIINYQIIYNQLLRSYKILYLS
jgi:NADH-quinone oxidoreductase subunit J